MLVNKNCIVSIKIIEDKKRLLLTNGEHLEVSREYSSLIDKLVLDMR